MLFISEKPTHTRRYSYIRPTGDILDQLKNYPCDYWQFETIEEATEFANRYIYEDIKTYTLSDPSGDSPKLVFAHMDNIGKPGYYKIALTDFHKLKGRLLREEEISQTVDTTILISNHHICYMPDHLTYHGKLIEIVKQIWNGLDFVDDFIRHCYGNLDEDVFNDIKNNLISFVKQAKENFDEDVIAEEYEKISLLLKKNKGLLGLIYQ